MTGWRRYGRDPCATGCSDRWRSGEGSSGSAVGGPQQRELLALLLLDANRVVSVDRLIGQLWGERPPATARSLLHGCVTDLRRALRTGDDGDTGQPLLSRPPGYLLRVRPGELDRDRAHELAAAAGGAAAAGTRTELERSAALLAEALALWRGPVLAGLTGPACVAEAARLEELALTLLERRVDVDLRLGRFADLAGELPARVRAQPLREPLWARLIIALYGAGRQADALAAYREVRRTLVQELGIELNAGLQRLERAVLARDDPVELVRREAGESPVAIARDRQPDRPAQLPAAVAGFAGRDGALAELDRLALAAGAATVVISAVSGTPGVGKTALAVHWAHRVADRFPDGQLYVNLRGFDPGGEPTEPSDALRGFLGALGVPAGRIPAGLDAQAALYRSVLDGRRVLVVLDNARDAEQARPLLPGTPTAAVVVTSRNRLTGLVATDGAHPILLDVLSVPEARALLARRLGAARLAAEPDAVDTIVDRCARLPLALAIAAARAATRPDHTLTAVAAELAAADDRLDALDAGEVGARVRAVFSWSYAALTPPAARLFRLLGLHPGPDLSAAAAAGLAGPPGSQTRGLLAELTRENLLAEPVPGRYACHDLLRAYAADLARSSDPDRARSAATARLLDHHLHTAYAAVQLLYPHRDPPIVPLGRPEDGAGVERPADDRAATAWLTAEYAVLLGVLDLAARLGCDAHTWLLAWALDPFLQGRADWPSSATAWQGAGAAAARLGDLAAQAYADRMLAGSYIRLGRHSDAHARLERGRAVHQGRRPARPGLHATGARLPLGPAGPAG
jgi:DNA-binding SARP family transcriptional activator